MFFLILLLHSLHFGKTSSPLSQALNRFSDYDFAFHYGNSSVENLNDLLTAKTTMCLVNYDGGTPASNIQRRNPILHVAFIEEPNDLKKYSFVDDLSREDIVVIVDKTKLNKKNYCARKDFRKAKAVFIFDWDKRSFSTCWYFYGKKIVGTRVIPIGTNGSITDPRTFINNFSDFGGYQFKVGYSEFHPFFYIHYQNGKYKFFGAEWTLLEAASNLLKFKYKLFKYTDNDTFGASDVMIEKVHSGIIDWAVGGISQTFTRTNTKKIEYSRYMVFQSYMAVYQRDKYGWSFYKRWLNYVYLSNWDSYLITAFSIVGIAVVAKLSFKISGRYKATIGEYVIMAALYLVEQQSTKLKRNIRRWKMGIKLIFLFWLFACTALTATMKSLQTYILMTSQGGFKNLEELTANGYKLQTQIDDFAHIKLHCLYTSSQRCSKLLHKIEILRRHCESIRSMGKNKVALIQEEVPLKYTVSTKCNLTIQQKLLLRFAESSIIPREWHAWPFQKDLPFINTFSEVISQLDAGGILGYWYRTQLNVYYNIYTNSEVMLRREDRALNVSDIAYPLCILICGYLVSTITFLAEVYNVKLILRDFIKRTSK